MLEPLVGHDRNRLCQVEGGEGRIDREGDDTVGERHLGVLEPVSLAAEQHRHILARAHVRHQKNCRLIGPNNRLRLIVGARGRREHDGTVGNRAFQGVEQADAVQDPIGSGGRAACLTIGPPSAAAPAAGGPSRNGHDPGAAPMFSPSCGSTRIMMGPGASIQLLVLSVPAPGMTEIWF